MSDNGEQSELSEEGSDTFEIEYAEKTAVEQELENLTEFNFVKYPSLALSKPSKPITDFNFSSDFIRNLFYTMKINGGISISAPTVGVNKRIALINITEPLIMINPVILVESKEKEEIEESNFAFLGYFYPIKRCKEITITYQDITGEQIVTKATGLLSAAMQHEVDAINGVMFYDHLNTISRYLAIKKLRNFIKKSQR